MLERLQSDEAAMNAIHEILQTDEEWGGDTIMAIVEQVRMSGREIV